MHTYNLKPQKTSNERKTKVHHSHNEQNQCSQVIAKRKFCDNQTNQLNFIASS